MRYQDLTPHTALSLSLPQTTFPNTGARIMLFAGGPATEGPGMVVGPELKEPIRSHHDIERDTVKHYKKALKVRRRALTFRRAIPMLNPSPLPVARPQFYDGLAKRVSTNGHVVDIYAGCLDQIGLLEMKSLANATNGFMILADSFAMAIFKQSFLRTLQPGEDGNLKMGFNATFDVQVRLAA